MGWSTSCSIRSLVVMFFALSRKSSAERAVALFHGEQFKMMPVGFTKVYAASTAAMVNLILYCSYNAPASAAVAQPCPFAFSQNRSRAAVALEARVRRGLRPVPGMFETPRPQ